MWFFRAIGLGFAAFMIGVCGAALLLVVVAMLGGPDLISRAGPIGGVASVPLFIWLMRRSKRKRDEGASDKFEDSPLTMVTALVVTALMNISAMFVIWLNPLSDSEGWTARLIAEVVLGVGTGAFLSVWAMFRKWKRRFSSRREGRH